MIATTQSKYPDQHKTLVEMGFDTASVNNALECTSGSLEGATAILVGELPPTTSSSRISAAELSIRSPQPMKVVGKSQATATKSTVQKPDIKEIHNKFMATYKIQKCKDKNTHDKRMCIYWHTKNDRRRNPFEIPYSCTECPYSTDTMTCELGDACLKAHNMLERMFHPELFKISMCQRGPNGSLCERGNLCAFAHSEEDHRIPLSHTLAKASNSSSTASSGTAPGASSSYYSSSVSSSSAVNSHSSAHPMGGVDSIQPGKAMSDSRLLDGIQEKLIRLIKNQGAEGIISSELPKRSSPLHSLQFSLHPFLSLARSF